jgi:hypothetical protein
MLEDIGANTEIVKAEIDLDVDELAVMVRDEIQEARKAWANALAHAMNAGDALIAVQPKVAERGIAWTKWLKENCFVAVSTAKLYMQLARHRDQIEVELRSKGELSLRGARQLISTVRDEDDEGPGDDVGDDHQAQGHEDQGETENPPDSETLIEHWRRSPAELTALLDAVGVAGILEAMSEEFGRQLRDRLPAPKRESNKPFKKALNLIANSTRNGREHGSRH